MCTSVSGAFDQVHNALDNFRGSIVKEKVAEQARYIKEKKWCTKNIARARKTLAARQHDVDSVKAHIKYLDNERKESIKDMNTRIARIAKNLANLKKFKKQRCNANLLFVKTLREHMEGVKVLKLLRGDIVKYFAKFNKKGKKGGKKGKKGGKKAKTFFLERFEEFSHLLDEKNTLALAELKKHVKLLTHKQIKAKDHKIGVHVGAATSTKARNKKQIGNKHIDNKRGELKRLKTPKWIKAEEYREQLSKRVLGMIDGLIKHLRASRKKLTRDEIKAAEDFAVFQINIFKENAHLRRTIKKLKAHIADLVRKLKKARVQLKHRVHLRDIAQNVLDHLIKICREKEEYHQTQVKRFARELKATDAAIGIFNKLLKRISLRVRSRTNANIKGKAYKYKNTNEVGEVKAKTEANLHARVKARHEIVFPQVNSEFDI